MFRFSRFGIGLAAIGLFAVQAAHAGVVTPTPSVTFTTADNTRDLPLTQAVPSFTADLSTYSSFTGQLHSLIGYKDAVGFADVEHQTLPYPDNVHGDIILPYAMTGRSADGALATFVYKFKLEPGTITGAGGTIDTAVYFRGTPSTVGANHYIGVHSAFTPASNLTEISNIGDFTKLRMNTRFADGDSTTGSYIGATSLGIPAGLSEFYVVFADEGSGARFAMTNFAVNASVVPVPEPASVGLLGLGVMGLCRRARR